MSPAMISLCWKQLSLHVATDTWCGLSTLSMTQNPDVILIVKSADPKIRQKRINNKILCSYAFLVIKPFAKSASHVSFNRKPNTCLYFNQHATYGTSKRIKNYFLNCHTCSLLMLLVSHRSPGVMFVKSFIGGLFL